MLRLMLMAACVAAGVWSAALQVPRESKLLYTKTIAASIISSAPPGARLIGTRGDLPPLIERLIHNATRIRYNIVDTFRCNGRVYGYYADQDNDCQIFHICVPMQQLFPDLYDAEDIYQFSFICPAYTIFTQDAMVCAWVDSAFPCSEAHHLYDRNNNFFVVPAEEVYREAPVSTTTTSTTTTTTTASTTTTSTRKPVSRPFWTYFRSTLASSPKPTTQFTPTVNQPITPQIELLPPPSTLPPETTPQEPSTTLLP